MASIRGLKKEIDLLMSLALSDCFYVLEYNPKVDKGKVMAIADDIIRNHHELRGRISKVISKDEPGKVKEYYNRLVSDMLDRVDSALEKLSAQVKEAG